MRLYDAFREVDEMIERAKLEADALELRKIAARAVNGELNGDALELAKAFLDEKPLTLPIAEIEARFEAAVEGLSPESRQRFGTICRYMLPYETPAWMPMTSLYLSSDRNEVKSFQTFAPMRAVRLTLESDRGEFSRVHVVSLNVGQSPIFTCAGGVPLREFQCRLALSEIRARWNDRITEDVPWNLDENLVPGILVHVEFVNQGDAPETITGAIAGFRSHG